LVLHSVLAVRWVRGVDLYELLAQCRELGQGFVIRAVQDRGLVDPRDGKGVGRLFPALRAGVARPAKAGRWSCGGVGAELQTLVEGLRLARKIKTYG
jgi:hypothetical protein